ncbi:cytochrome P450 [Streptomyces albireticuli]|nr:cytochrome P450 [Streptomyces albireticuli]MCD9195861.1 cytochrome P450 [Streptomyces albireticuli]
MDENGVCPVTAATGTGGGARVKDLPTAPMNIKAGTEFFQIVLQRAGDISDRWIEKGEVFRFPFPRVPWPLSIAVHAYADGWTAEAVSVNSARLARELYTRRLAALDQEDGKKSLSFVLGAQSPFLLRGPEHAQVRRAMASDLTPQAVERYRKTSVAVVDRMIDALPLGEEVLMHDFYSRVTQEIILRVVLGLDDGAELEEFKKLLYAVGSHITPSVKRLPGYMASAAFTMTALSGKALGDRTDTALRAVSPRAWWMKRHADRLLYRRIRELRAKPNDSMASRIIAFAETQSPAWTDRRIRDTLSSLLMAGHDTSVNAYSWATDYLLHDARARELLVTEARQGVSDRYMRAVNLEALRLRPPVWGLVPVADHDFELGGYRIRKGSVVFVAASAVNCDPAVYEDPYRFKPERFLDVEPDAPYGFITFGAGRHRCPGTAFYDTESRLVLHRVFGRLEMEPVLPQVGTTAMSFAMLNRPAERTPVIVRARVPADGVPWYRPVRGEAVAGRPTG